MNATGPGNLEFRQPRTDEVHELQRVAQRSYGRDATDERLALGNLVIEVDRCFGALDDRRWVAASGAHSLSATLPGGATLPAAGIAGIGVDPVHRRRGALSRMLTWHHTDARRRGEPLALLMASESSIYRRFGYGVVTEAAHVRIPARAVVFDPPVATAGTFELVDSHEDTSALEATFGTARHSRPGWVHRKAGMWAQVRADPDFARGGHTEVQAVIHRNADGDVDGYATWRIAEHQGVDGIENNTLHVDEIIALNPETDAALWEFLAHIDLVTTLVWANAPVEPAIRYRLAEPRQLCTLARHDQMWAALLDVPAALSSRTYGDAGSLEIDVLHPAPGEATQRYHLHCPGRGATGHCETVGTSQGPPDLTVSTPDLASIMVGGAAPSLLAAAGRVQAGNPAAIGLADGMCALPSPLWCPVDF